MSFWDDLKDVFKTDDERDDEQKRRLAEAKAGEDELERKLAELDKNFKNKNKKTTTYDIDALFPEDSGLREIEYVPRTDEDIVDAANKEVDYKRAQEKGKIESDFNANSATLEKGKRKADQTLKESFQNLENVYKELRQNAENDAIKRGVARSSIIISKLGDLDEAKMLSAGEIRRAYDETVGDINSKINTLETDRDKALENLDLKYASELADRIANLKAERDSVVEKYEKYNNQIREKQTKYAKQRQSDIDKFLKEKEKEAEDAEKAQEAYEKKNGYQGEKLAEYQNRYDLAYDFYMSLSPDIAVDALKSAANMKYYLGNYYDKLLTALKSRVTNVSGSRKTYF